MSMAIWLAIGCAVAAAPRRRDDGASGREGLADQAVAAPGGRCAVGVHDGGFWGRLLGLSCLCFCIHRGCEDDGDGEGPDDGVFR